jgi:hypothetical protein
MFVKVAVEITAGHQRRLLTGKIRRLTGGWLDADP